MKFSELNELTQQLPENQRNAILALIDFKTNDDMDRVISEIKTLRSDINTKFESELKMIRSEINVIEAKFKILFWIYGIGTTLITLLVTLYKFIG